MTREENSGKSLCNQCVNYLLSCGNCHMNRNYKSNSKTNDEIRVDCMSCKNKSHKCENICVGFEKTTSTATSVDYVSSPPHYTAGGIETIDYMKAKMTREQFIGNLVGNTIKYISRFPLKNGIEDLKKAQWYLNKLITTLEE